MKARVSRCDHLFPAPRLHSPRRAASPAAAPDGPPPLRLSLPLTATAPPPRPPPATPSGHAHMRAPRPASPPAAEPQSGQWGAKSGGMGGSSLGHAPFPQYWLCAPPSCGSNGPAARCGKGGVQSKARSLAASEGSPLGHSHPLVSAQHSLDSKRPRRPLYRPPLPCAALCFGLPRKGQETRLVWKALPIHRRPCHFSAPAGDAQSSDQPR